MAVVRGMRRTLGIAPSSARVAASQSQVCLLYTSDAADERSSVDLGGRRIIKKKTRRTYAELCMATTKAHESESQQEKRWSTDTQGTMDM